MVVHGVDDAGGMDLKHAADENPELQAARVEAEKAFKLTLQARGAAEVALEEYQALPSRAPGAKIPGDEKVLIAEMSAGAGALAKSQRLQKEFAQAKASSDVADRKCITLALNQVAKAQKDFDKAERVLQSKSWGDEGFDEVSKNYLSAVEKLQDARINVASAYSNQSSHQLQLEDLPLAKAKLKQENELADWNVKVAIDNRDIETKKAIIRVEVNKPDSPEQQKIISAAKKDHADAVVKHAEATVERAQNVHVNERDPIKKAELLDEIQLARAELSKAEADKRLAQVNSELLEDPLNEDYLRDQAQYITDISSADQAISEATTRISENRLARAQEAVVQSQAKVEAADKTVQAAEADVKERENRLAADNVNAEGIEADIGLKHAKAKSPHVQAERELAKAQNELDKDQLNLLNAQKTDKAAPSKENKLAIEVAKAKVELSQAKLRAATDANESAFIDMELELAPRDATPVNKSLIESITKRAAEARELKKISASGAEAAAKDYENNPSVKEQAREAVLEATLIEANAARLEITTATPKIERLKKNIEDLGVLIAANPGDRDLAFKQVALEEELKAEQGKVTAAQTELKEIDARRREQVGLIAAIDKAKTKVKDAKEEVGRKQEVYDLAVDEGGDSPSSAAKAKIDQAREQLTAAETALKEATADQTEAEQEANDALLPKEAVKKQEAVNKSKSMKDFATDTEIEKAKKAGLLDRASAQWEKFGRTGVGQFFKGSGERIKKGVKTAHTLKEEDLLEAAITNLLLLLFEILFGLSKGSAAIFRELNRDHLNSKEFRAMAKEDHAEALKEADQIKAEKVKPANQNQDKQDELDAKYKAALLKMAQAEATYSKYGSEEDNQKYDELKAKYDDNEEKLVKAKEKRDKDKKAYDAAPFFNRSKEEEAYKKSKSDVEKLERDSLIIYNQIKSLNTREDKHSKDLVAMKNAARKEHKDGMVDAEKAYKGVQKYSEYESDINVAKEAKARLTEEVGDLNKDLVKCEKELEKPGLSEKAKKTLNEKKTDLEKEIKEKNAEITSNEGVIKSLEKEQGNLGLDDVQKKMAKAEQERGNRLTVKRILQGGQKALKGLFEGMGGAESVLAVDAGEELVGPKADEPEVGEPVVAAAPALAEPEVEEEAAEALGDPDILDFGEEDEARGLPPTPRESVSAEPLTPTPPPADPIVPTPPARPRTMEHALPPDRPALERSHSTPAVAPSEKKYPKPPRPLGEPPAPSAAAPEILLSVRAVQPGFSEQLAANGGKGVKDEELIGKLRELIVAGTISPPAPNLGVKPKDDKEKVNAMVEVSYFRYLSSNGPHLHQLTAEDKERARAIAQQINEGDKGIQKDFVNAYDAKPKTAAASTPDTEAEGKRRSSVTKRS